MARFLQVFYMRIGVTMFRDSVSPRLDISDSLIIYRIDKGKIKQKEKINLIYDQPGQLFTILEQKKMDIIMCNSCPGYFYRMISSNGSKIICNVKGEPDEIIKTFINEKLQDFRTHGSSTNNEYKKNCNKVKIKNLK